MSQSELPAVMSKDGVRGILVEGSPDASDTSRVLVQFETGQRVLVRVDALQLQADGRSYVLPMRLDELEQHQDRGDQPMVVPVVEETVDVQKQRVVTGRVQVRKRVHEHEEVVDEPLLREDVAIDRVTINQIVERPAEVRREGNVLVIPIMEEVLVVEKRLRLREELRITLQQTEVHEPQTVTLRREEVEIDRLDVQEQQVGEGTDHAAEEGPSRRKARH